MVIVATAFSMHAAYSVRKYTAKGLLSVSLSKLGGNQHWIFKASTLVQVLGEDQCWRLEAPLWGGVL